MYTIDNYNKKRDFSATPEPSGKKGSARTEHLSFVIQKHDATRLHYDFRLEMDGVLKSWAIPKGPSLNPSDKRLAVRTEDHPMDYADFEGIIPEHHYGAGEVIIWDQGEWIPDDKDPLKALKKGKLSFTLKGERLSGHWTLARMGGARNKDKENWLLIKGSDEIASSAIDITKENPHSIKSGRTLADLQKKPKTEKLEPLLARYTGPQLATLVDKPPAGSDWLHEVKYDGYRILAFISGSEVIIRTRNGHIWTEKFPILKKALAELNIGTAIFDGEAVMVDADGLTDFKALQNALDTNAPMQYYMFDLLYYNGRDLSQEPFSERRRALTELLKGKENATLHLSETFTAKADEVLSAACKLGLEGVISKKASAAYSAGRSKSWVKSKCIKRQEFIICGFVPSSDIPNAIGALHLGYYKGKNLAYAGKVGTGFNEEAARNLFQTLQKIPAENHPFSESPGRQPKTIWVKPELLCEVKFGMWTPDGKIRHSSYQGLRADKSPQEIAKEEPMPVKTIAVQAKSEIKSKKKSGELSVGGVRISHPDRVIFPDADVTKGELAAFYAEMAEFIMPRIADRLISVVRCPGGIDQQCFFQRGKGRGMPEHITPLDVKHKNKLYDYMYISSAEGLIELVQMGVIEVHPWGSRIDNVDKPEQIIFDFDPDPTVPFEAIKLAAQDLRQRLQRLGLESLVKASGGKGLHIIVPIQRRYEWDVVKGFAAGVAAQMVRDLPDVYIATMSKEKRHGKIFVDYFRNDFAATAVMDYCVRSRPGASVAVPLLWPELGKVEAANQFTIAAALKRKKQAAQWLQEYQSIKQSLTKAILAAV